MRRKRPYRFKMQALLERIQQMKNSSGNKSTSKKFKKVRFQTHQRTENDESDQLADYEDSGPSSGQQKERDYGGVVYTQYKSDESHFVCDQKAGMGSLDSGCTVSISHLKPDTSPIVWNALLIYSNS